MRVRIEVSGHQYSHEYVGNVLAWGQTSVLWGGHLRQTPCVVIELDDNSIEVVPIGDYGMRYAKVTRL